MLQSQVSMRRLDFAHGSASRTNRPLSDPDWVTHCCDSCFLCSVANPHQLFFSGAVKGESAMTSLEDIGSPVDVEFVVSRFKENSSTGLARWENLFCNLLHSPCSLRWSTRAKLWRRSAPPTSTSCGLMSLPMRNGSCTQPVWSSRITPTHTVPSQPPLTPWSSAAPHLQDLR